MAAYYNEVDPFAAQWLRNLIAAGRIAPGVVDERSIEDVRPDDLRGFTQCHFFAGIGVWSYALRRAGWPDDRPVWTGSCPCQPFSSAGKGSGFDDERHLWPSWHHIIQQCRPAVIFGEQVASKDAEPWLDLVQDDMEGLDYAFGAVPFPAAGVGAPHIRDRLYWVANSDTRRGQGRNVLLEPGHVEHDGGACRLADHDANGRTAAPGAELHDAEHHAQPCGGAGGLGHANGECVRRRPGTCHSPEASSRDRQYGDDAESAGSHGHSLVGDTGGQGLALGSLSDDGGRAIRLQRPAAGAAEPVRGFWSGADWIACRDGKWRPVEPGTFPLAHGAAGRVGRLRAYGNAIVAPQAAEFISAYLDTFQ